MHYLSSCTQKYAWNYKSCEIRFQDGWMRSANTTSVLCRRTTIITMDRVNIQTKGLRLVIWKTGKCYSGQSHFILKASYQAVQKKSLRLRFWRIFTTTKNIFNTTFFIISFLQPERFELVFVVAAGVEQMQKNIDFKNSGLKLIDWIIFDLRTNHRL